MYVQHATFASVCKCVGVGAVLGVGRRRLEAYKLMEESTVPVTVVPLKQILLGERAENIERLDLQLTEAVAVARGVRALEEQEAKKRRQETEGRPRKQLDETGVESTPVKERKSRQKTAKAVGMGWQKLERAREVVEAAEADPEQFGDLPDEMDRTGRVNGVYKKLQGCRRIRISFDSTP